MSDQSKAMSPEALEHVLHPKFPEPDAWTPLFGENAKYPQDGQWIMLLVDYGLGETVVNGRTFCGLVMITGVWDDDDPDQEPCVTIDGVVHDLPRLVAWHPAQQMNQVTIEEIRSRDRRIAELEAEVASLKQDSVQQVDR